MVTSAVTVPPDVLRQMFLISIATIIGRHVAYHIYYDFLNINEISNDDELDVDSFDYGAVFHVLVK